MAMREPVAMDFMGVGPAAGGRNGSRGSSEAAEGGGESGGFLARPIPNGVHARNSPKDGGGSTITHAFASPGNNLHGLRKQPWSRRFQSEEGYAAVSPKRERASPDVAPDVVQAQHLSDDSAPASPSHHNPGEFWRMQQLQLQSCKNQPIYAGHLQAGARRISPLRDEAFQRGDHADPEKQRRPHSSPGAFGSPTPFQYQANGAEAMAYKRSPFHNYPFQAGNVLGHTFARPASGGGKQQQPPSATQLTIFYAGMVNVYNDVPFDKAQAIMLLAGSGNSWSSNYMSPPVASGAAAGRIPFLKTPMSAPQSTPSTPGSPSASPHVPTAAGHPPRSGVIFSNVRQPPITNVELPQARKASLARFLEKRKDRTRKTPVNEDVESASASRDKSPGPSTSQPSTRSPSPSPAVQEHHHRASSRAPSGAPSAQPRRDHGSEPNSPPTKPPSTPPRQSGALDSEKKILAAPKRRDDSSDQAHHLSKRACRGRLHDPEESSSL